MKFEELLGRSVRGFWATTYSFDVKLFDQYLLRRLAESPLNAVVLVDHDKLSTGWEQLHSGNLYLARQAGRRYLVRGVRSPGGGAFHPKTYLLARADHATLVVGSGNLTRDGIDHGREAFTSFTTQNVDDLPSMRAWARWMSRLVDGQADSLLTERWLALREVSPWMTGDDSDALFVHNAERPLLEQLAARMPAEVVELHVTAPFFDRDAVALERLVETARPARLDIYMGAGCSVHGPALRQVLESAAAVRIQRFDPSRFVHAKLVGAVGADGAGVVLCGSANLSRAALLLDERSAGGNREAGVIRAGSADAVRDVFAASGLGLIEEPLSWLEDLSYDDDHPSLGHRHPLDRAQWCPDGRIAVFGPGPVPREIHLWWEDADAPVPLDSAGVTVDVLSDVSPRPVLVALADATGRPLSNRVAVDDPSALRETLLGKALRASRRPAELEHLQLSPLIALVLWAHDKFIFDPEETPAFRRAQQAIDETADAEEAGHFWERYATEELQYDPRRQSYQPLTVGGAVAQPVDELLRELELLLHAAPSVEPAVGLRVVTLADGNDPKSTDHGTPWSLDAKQRVRAFHLLTRWAAAVADPRHALVAPHAPVVNYETLLGIILLTWVNGALEVGRCRSLLLDLVSAFVGDRPGRGFLGQASDPTREDALRRLDPGFVEIAAGLVYVALSTPGWGADIYDWQPSLARAIDLGVVLPGPLSASTVLHVTGANVPVEEVDELLTARVTWVDEETWCERLAAELGLDGLRFERFNPPRIPFIAVVTGALYPLYDTRLLTVARRAQSFLSVEAIAVGAGDDRFIFEPNGPARARVSTHTHQSATPVTAARLIETEHQGGAWADLLDLGRPPALRSAS